jgi:hypothetical protein
VPTLSRVEIDFLHDELDQVRLNLPMVNGVILGSYAAGPVFVEAESSLQRYSDELKRFQLAVRGLSYVVGLEIPFTSHGLGVSVPGAGLAAEDICAQNWDVVITALPLQMEKMALDPHYGLASLNEESRKAAVLDLYQLLRSAHALQKLRPDLRLRAIEIHSGPRRRKSDLVAKSQSANFLKSMREILAHLSELDWPPGGKPNAQLPNSVTSVTAPASHRPNLFIEHCDAGAERDEPAKGFLSLAEELQVLGQLMLTHPCSAGSPQLGLIVNWGRSAIEGRSAEMPTEHVLQAQSFLRGIVFSGVAAVVTTDATRALELTSEPACALYGHWQDSHAPIGDENDLSLLMTEKEIAQTLRASAGRKENEENFFVGLKIQPLPKSLSVDARLDFLRQNLERLRFVVEGYKSSV